MLLMGQKPGWRSKEELAQLRQKPQEELDLAFFNTNYGVLVIEELVIEGRLQVHFDDFNIHRWSHWMWAFATVERSRSIFRRILSASVQNSYCT